MRALIAMTYPNAALWVVAELRNIGPGKGFQTAYILSLHPQPWFAPTKPGDPQPATIHKPTL
jgi:hypothetical protein